MAAKSHCQNFRAQQLRSTPHFHLSLSCRPGRFSASPTRLQDPDTPQSPAVRRDPRPTVVSRSLARTDTSARPNPRARSDPSPAIARIEKPEAVEPRNRPGIRPPRGAPAKPAERPQPARPVSSPVPHVDQVWFRPAHEPPRQFRIAPAATTSSARLYGALSGILLRENASCRSLPEGREAHAAGGYGQQPRQARRIRRRGCVPICSLVCWKCFFRTTRLANTVLVCSRSESESLPSPQSRRPGCLWQSADRREERHRLVIRPQVHPKR